MPMSPCSTFMPPSLPVSPGPRRPLSQNSWVSDSYRPLSSLSYASMSSPRPASQGWVPDTPRARASFAVTPPVSSRGCHSHRGQSNGSRRRTASSGPRTGNGSAVKAVVARQAKTDEDLEVVQPPWGAERANSDFPPYEEVALQRQHYFRILDAQANLQREQEKRRLEEEVELERSTLTSLELHPVGHHLQLKALSTQRQRAVYEEIRAAAVRQQESEKQHRDTARQDYKRWADHQEIDSAQRWYAKRQEDRRKQMNLAAVWKATTDERRAREAKARDDTLAAEREAVQRDIRGMVKRRPMKRSKEKCLRGEPVLSIGSADPYSTGNNFR